MPGRHVCSPSTGPCFCEIPGSGWRHCLQLGQRRWAGRLLHTSEVSPVIFTAPLTLLFSANSMTSLTPFRSNCKAQLTANTFHHLLPSPDFAPVRHPLPAARGLSEAVNYEKLSGYLLWICACIVWHIMTGGNSCWSMQCTLMMKPGWPDLHKRLQWSHRKYFHVDFLGTWHWRHGDLWGSKKTPQAHLLEVGGGSKIKSAVTVCSLDRGEHIVPELVSSADLDFGLERPCRSGVRWPWCGISTCWVPVFYNSSSLYLVGDEHFVLSCDEWKFVCVSEWFQHFLKMLCWWFHMQKIYYQICFWYLPKTHMKSWHWILDSSPLSSCLVQFYSKYGNRGKI